MPMTTIQAFNKIAKKLRNIKTDLSVLTSLTVEQALIFEEMVTVLKELSTYTTWHPLRKQGTITLAENDNDYIQPADFYMEHPESFKYNNKRPIYKGSQEQVDRFENDRTVKDEPRFYFLRGGNFVFDSIPNAAAHGKIITYDYFYIPADPSTASPTTTLWIPAPFDDTVYCNWVIRNMFENRESNQALVYSRRIDGTSDTIGSLEKMLNAYEDSIQYEQVVQTADNLSGRDIPTRDYGWRAN